MDMTSYTISVSYSITSGNENWRGQIDEGVDPPAVTGGSIDLPQGGSRQSKAAVTGGVYTAAAEVGAHAEENSKKIINSSLKEVVSPVIVNMIKGDSSGIQQIEFFLTNIVKNEYIKTAAEFSDNHDEAEATQQVIDSVHVVVEISGVPTEEEVMQTVTEKINEILTGGVSQ